MGEACASSATFRPCNVQDLIMYLILKQVQPFSLIWIFLRLPGLWGLKAEVFSFLSPSFCSKPLALRLSFYIEQ